MQRLLVMAGMIHSPSRVVFTDPNADLWPGDYLVSGYGDGLCTYRMASTGKLERFHCGKEEAPKPKQVGPFKTMPGMGDRLFQGIRKVTNGW